MKLKKKLFKAILSATLLGAIVAAPAAAQDMRGNYSHGQTHGQQTRQGRYKAHNVTFGQDYGYQQNTYRNNSYQHQSGGFYSNQQPAYTPVNYPGNNQAPYSECDTQPTYCPQGNQTTYNTGYQQQYAPVQPQQVNPAVTTVSFEQEVLNLTNQARAQHGLAPLQAHQSLGSAASSHSQEMLNLNYFSHTSPTLGRATPSERVAQAGASPNYVAENIFQASGHNTASVAQLAVESWLQSPGHRRNMLSPQATHIGIGFVEMNGTVSVTQVFGAGL